MVGHVFDDLHLGMNGLKALPGLLVSFEPAKGHVEPVSCSGQHVAVLGDLDTFPIRPQGVPYVIFQIISQTQMIPDVPLKGADGNIPGIGHAVRFCLIFFSLHQTCSVFEIFNGPVEFTGGNVSKNGNPSQISYYNFSLYYLLPTVLHSFISKSKI